MKNTINNITLAIILFFGAVQVSYAVEQNNIVSAASECKKSKGVECKINSETSNLDFLSLDSLKVIKNLPENDLESIHLELKEINSNYNEDYEKIENSVYELQIVELQQYVKLLDSIRLSSLSINDKNNKYRDLNEQLSNALKVITNSSDVPFENIQRIKEQKTHEAYAKHLNKEAVTKKQ